MLSQILSDKTQDVGKTSFFTLAIENNEVNHVSNKNNSLSNLYSLL